MVAERLLDREHNLLAPRIGTVGIILRDAEPRHVLHPRLALHALADEEVAVVLEPRRECEAEQALLVPRRPRRRTRTEIQKELRLGLPGADHVDHAALVGHEQPAGAVAGVGHQQGPQGLGRLAVVGLRIPIFPGDLGQCRHGSDGKGAFTCPRHRLSGCQFADLDRAERDLVTMILKTEMTLLSLAEPGKPGELALRHPLVPVARADREVVVVQAVEADLAAAGGDAKGEMVPLAGWPACIEHLGRL